MRFLADENLPNMLIQMLIAEGHDVVGVTQFGAEDVQVLSDARLADRVLITLDKDFGELIFLRGCLAAGVILVRLPGLSIVERVEHLRRLLPILEREALGHFIVVSEDRLRSKKI